MDRYNEIIDDDSNYDYVDTSKRKNDMRSIYGKNLEEIERKVAELLAPYEDTETPREVADEIDRLYSYQISDEVYPEVAALEYMIWDFTCMQRNIYPDMYKGTDWASFDLSDNDESNPAFTEGYNKRTLYQIENGVTYDRNFGWLELIASGQRDVPLVVAVTVAIAAIILFTGEYTNKTDVLLMSSVRGRKKAAMNKIVAGGIFSVAVTVYYLLLLLVVYGCFFSLDGGTSDSALFINGRIFTYIECFGIMAACWIICILAITATALAVSSFCTKMIPSILISFLIVLVPFIVPFAVYVGGNNFGNILDTLAVNAILTDFGYSWYDVYNIGGKALVIESHILIVPLALAQLFIALPFVKLGWKKHKISN